MHSFDLKKLGQLITLNMPHTTRNNYKARAQRGVSAISEDRDRAAIEQIDNLFSILQIESSDKAQIRQLLGDLTTEIRCAVGSLDDTGIVGPLTFDQVTHDVDHKLRNRDIFTILSRSCDVVTELNERVLALHDALVLSHKQRELLRGRIDNLKQVVKSAVISRVEFAAVGPGFTQQELTEYEKARQTSGKYARYGLGYDLNGDESASMETNGSMQQVTFNKPPSPRREATNRAVAGTH